MKITILSISCLIVIGIGIFLFQHKHDGRKWAVNPRVKHLNEIGIACSGYAADHEGRYPDDWANLVPKYISASEAGTFLARFALVFSRSTTNVMEWTDYVYFRGITTDSPPNAIVAFLPPGYNGNFQESVVLFADGSIQSMNLSEFTKTLNKKPNNGVVRAR
jgi:hypothetical protein